MNLPGYDTWKTREPHCDDHVCERCGLPTAASGLCEAINSEVPLSPRKPTIAAWLDQLAGKLELCANRDEAEREVLSDEVLKASRTLRGDGRLRLRAVIDAALAQHLGEPS
jgi:hypothetical protein